MQRVNRKHKKYIKERLKKPFFFDRIKQNKIEKRLFYLEITGEVKDIIYQNEINSYTVAEFET